MNRHVNAIAGRLSLRPPQRRSLEILARIAEIAPPGKNGDTAALLAAIQSEFPSVVDFEREFPSLCFALATGVGKTRLMGAFISYLHLAHGINNFFVLAPNLTIYNKLITDFTPNTAKYVFKGIAEFAANPPTVITGDTYESGVGVREDWRKQRLLPGMDAYTGIHVNIFNISKINSEVRGGKSPRIKRLSEYIGESYFDYLAGLPDLVLLSPSDKSNMAKYLFGGFDRCLYPVQKFDSDAERKLAVILDRDAIKWFKPAKGQFQIFYRHGSDHLEYQPDFVAEAAEVVLMLEPKASNQMDDPIVVAKKEAALNWCANASAHAQSYGGKPWRYVLIPHDEIATNITVKGLAVRFGS